MKVFELMQLRQNKVIFIVLCVLFLLYSLGYFFVKKINDVVFQEPIIFENAEDIESILKVAFADRREDNPGLSVIYFWKPYCPCNLGVGPHYSELVKEYGEKNVNFYIADLSFGESLNHIPAGKLLEAGTVKLLSFYVQYSPAIAILNTDNDLLYYGPHNLGFVCNVETSIASKVIDSFSQGIFSKNINVLGKGCFCRA